MVMALGRGTLLVCSWSGESMWLGAGVQILPDRLGASAYPLFLVPPPLGGASGAESWLRVGVAGLSLLPILLTAEEILEGGQDKRPGFLGAGEGGAGTLAPGADPLVAFQGPDTQAQGWQLSI